MSENGTENKRSLWKDLTDQLSDHIDLAALELGYEAQEAVKRLTAAGIIFILVLTAFIGLQVALIGLLIKLGLSLGLASFILSVVYFAAAFVIYRVLGRRDKRVGPPFAATHRELKGTLRWIQRIF